MQIKVDIVEITKFTTNSHTQRTNYYSTLHSHFETYTLHRDIRHGTYMLRMERNVATPMVVLHYCKF